MRNPVWSFFFALLLFCLGSAPAYGTAPPSAFLPHYIFAAEQFGQFEAAENGLKDLDDAEKKAPDLLSHIKSLSETIRALQIADVYRKNGHADWAKALLDAQMARLDPVRDSLLLIALEREKANIQAEALEQADALARKRLTTAEALASAGKYDDALGVYDEVLELHGEVSPALIRDARIAKEEAVAKRAGALAPRFWAELGTAGATGARTVVQWLVYLAAGAALLLLFTFVRKQVPLYPGTILVLQDLTVSAADRESMSQHLVREILYRIRELSSDQSGGAAIDRIKDLDSAGLANLRIDIDPLAELAPLIQGSTAALQIGPFSLNPGQFLAWFRSVLQRSPERLLQGSLYTQNNQTIVIVEQLSLTQGRMVEGRWEARGDDRDTAVHRIATRIAFELAHSRVTTDWGSFKLYREALDQLFSKAPNARTEERQKCLECACEKLQEALRCDPANWVARFHLATAQRKLGNNRAAAENLEFLNRMIIEAGSCGSLSDFVREHPEFQYAVYYEWSVCLSKIRDRKALSRKAALKMLQGLITKLTGIPQPAGEDATLSSNPQARIEPAALITLNEPQRLRLEMLARSARASVMLLAFESEDAQEIFRSENFSKIKEDHKWIEWLPLSTPELDWQAYSLAHAVIENAYGRAAYLLGNISHATQSLQKALLLEPDLVDAYNNLAEIYIRQKDRSERDWLQEAKGLLIQALEISPQNQKAHYLLGRLYMDTKESASAEEHFKKADLLAWSYFYRADMITPKNSPAAVELLRKSLALDRTPDYRSEKLIQILLDGSPPPSTLREAHNLAQRLSKYGRTEKYRKRGRAFLSKIEAAIAAAVPAKGTAPAQGAVPAGK
jgi:tetratricopeptide (TPR) repeat protein